MKFVKVLKNHRVIDMLAMAATAIFFLAGLLVSLNRYWQYETFYYNFGVFDQAIWHISRFQPPVIEHLLVGGKINLADHFDLSILLFAPIFWLTSRSEGLLVIQALFAALAGFVIYKIGIAILKDKFIALCLACCYFLFVGIQNAVITDFQELTIMSFPITLTFYMLITKRKKLFWLFFLLTLGYKEVTVLLGIGIAIFMFFYNPSWRKHALIAAVISILWGFLTMKVFIPYFSGGVYLHQPDLPDGIVNQILAMGDHQLKRETLFWSQANFGFMPLFAPSMWPVIIQDYILRFIPKLVETRWTLGLHYNAQVAPLLAIASILGFAFWQQRIKLFAKYKYVIAVLIVLSSFIQFRFIHHGPFLMSINPALYSHTANFKYLDKAIAKIPPNVSIMTQNNLGVRFDHQKFVYLREGYEPYKPEYILLDNRAGQNPNNFLFSPTAAEILPKIEKDTNYKLIYHEAEVYIFKRK